MLEGFSSRFIKGVNPFNTQRAGMPAPARSAAEAPPAESAEETAKNKPQAPSDYQEIISSTLTADQWQMYYGLNITRLG